MYRLANLIAASIAAAIFVAFALVFCMACSSEDVATANDVSAFANPWMQAAAAEAVALSE